MGTENGQQENKEQQQPQQVKQVTKKDDRSFKKTKEVNKKVIIMEHFQPKTIIKLSPEIANTTADIDIHLSPQKQNRRYVEEIQKTGIVFPKIDQPTIGHRKLYSELKKQNDMSLLGEFCYNQKGEFDLERSIQKPKIDCVKNRKPEQNNDYPSKDNYLTLNKEKWYSELEPVKVRDSLTYKSHIMSNVSQLQPDRIKGKLCNYSNSGNHIISQSLNKVKKNVGFITPTSEQFKINIQNNYNFKYPIKYQEKAIIN